MIQIEQISKTYYTKEKKGTFHHKRAVEAVKNLSFTIPENKITGLLGINGAGKTTTVKMLSTLIEPTSGHIIFDGLDLKRNQKTIKKKINMIAGGERMIYWRLTARENLYYFGQMYGLHQKHLKSQVELLLETVGLTDKADIPVEKYSKGMKQRLQIARGLINNPDYIFLDEPTLGLDVQIAKEMRAYFKTIAQQGKGILLTTHYMQEVEELCDYIYILHDGQLIREGTPKEIASLHKGPEASLEDAIIQLAKEFSDASGGK